MLRKTKTEAIIPGFAQVRQYVYALVASTPKKAMEPLTTERELCELFGMARGTIRRALEKLVEEGILIRRPHYGTFINPNILESLPGRPCIGIVIGNSNYAFLSDYNMAQLKGAFDAAIGTGFDTRLLNFNEEPARALTLFKGSGAKGLLWLDCGMDAGYLLEHLEKLGMPFVLALPTIDPKAYDNVNMDFFDYGLQLGRSLISKGLLHTLFLSNNAPYNAEQKKQGCMKAFAEASIPWNEKLWKTLGQEKARAAIEEELSQNPQLQAIYATESMKHILDDTLQGRPDIAKVVPTITGPPSAAFPARIPAALASSEAMKLLIRRLGEDSSSAHRPLSMKIKMEILDAKEMNQEK